MSVIPTKVGFSLKLGRGGGEEIPCQAQDDGDATWLEEVPAYAGMTKKRKGKRNETVTNCDQLKTIAQDR